MFKQIRSQCPRDVERRSRGESYGECVLSRPFSVENMVAFVFSSINRNPLEKIVTLCHDCEMCSSTRILQTFLSTVPPIVSRVCCMLCRIINCYSGPLRACGRALRWRSPRQGPLELSTWTRATRMQVACRPAASSWAQSRQRPAPTFACSLSRGS
jgi:hypothetical protein